MTTGVCGRTLALRALLVCGGLVLGALGAEGLLRLVPAYRLERTGYGCRVMDRAGWRPSPLYGYELVPHSDPTVNAFGMRDREYTLAKPSGVFRVAVLGDSLTDVSLWTARLEDELNRAGRFEVLNFAVMGYNLYQYVQVLDHKVRPFDPDLVLVAFCLNDIPAWYYSMAAQADARTGRTYLHYFGGRPGEASAAHLDRAMRLNRRIDPRLYRHSALYRFLVLSSFGPLGGKARDGDEVPAALLEKLKSLSGGRVAGVVFPFLTPETRYCPDERRQYDMSVRLLRRAGIRYLDLHGLFNARGERIVELRKSPEDVLHFNAAADTPVAREVAAWLLRPDGPVRAAEAAHHQ